ncbi:histone acetylation protein-domain-containing protein [Hysterangium stoloniferum]|nr:histone acetylation protein-domain-containing protein [Hysterangium stoloniferum]
MTSQPLPSSALRSHLLTVLSKLPGARTFYLHVLVSAHRKPSQSLFPYADTRPKCFVQDILVLLAEHSISEAQQGSTDDTTPRTFVTAIEAAVFAFPTSHSTILYISKVDGTGQGLYPSPTSTLVRAFIEFYASPSSPLYSCPRTHHLWVHLFARAQRQYLFPNSADHPIKNPLGDVGLCKWWKKTLTEVAKTLLSHHIHLFYLLPGQSELEARYLLRETESQPSQSLNWAYSHPYDVHAWGKIPYVSATSSKTSSDDAVPVSLAYLIPHFEDDPKRRFLDELAVTSEAQPVAIPTPKRKRRKTEERNSAIRLSQTSPQSPRTPRRPKTDLDTTSIGEFWERMSYRQECSQGAVTGFFTAVFSQQCDFSMEVDAVSNISSEATSAVDGHPTLLVDGTIPHTIIKRIMSSLLTGVEFSNAERSHKGTQVIESTIKGLCEGLGRPNVDPSPSNQNTDGDSHPEHLTLDIYYDHIYASLSVVNPPSVRKTKAGAGGPAAAAPVNVLGVRRKKKRELE